MNLLDEALELLRGADGNWQSMRAEGTVWEDRMLGRAQRARAAAAARASQGADARRAARRGGAAGRGSGRVRAGEAPPGGELPLGQREQHWRLWRAGAVLIRSEYEIAHETVTVVAQGSRWWRWSASLGSTSGSAASRPLRVVLGPAAVLVAGLELAAELEPLDAGHARIAGRDAVLVRARPIGRTGSRTVLREAGLGADEYELRVDAERGALLGVSALAGGRPFRVVAATLVGFDETFTPSKFAPPAAQQGRFVAHLPRQLELADLPGVLPFAVLVPEPSPSSYPPHVAVLAAERAGSDLRAVLTWPVGEDGRRGQLRLQLTAGEPAPSARDHWVAAGDVITAEDSSGPVARRRVRTFRHGVYAELECSVLGLDRLVVLARSLEPFRRDAPSLRAQT